MNTWRLDLTFSDGGTPLSISQHYLLSDSFAPKWCVGPKGSHQTQSLTMLVQSRQLGARVASSSGRIDAVLFKDDVPYFTGTMRANASLSASGSWADPISIELLDYSDSLHQYIYSVDQVDEIDGTSITEHTITGSLPIVDNDNMHQSIIGKLFALAGITNVISSFSIPNNGDAEYPVEAGKYVDDLIEDVLYQYMADYRCMSDGTIQIINTEPPVEVPTDVIETSDILNTFSLTKQDDDTDGTTVLYTNTRIAKQMRIAYNSVYWRETNSLIGVWEEWGVTNQVANFDFSELRNANPDATVTIRKVGAMKMVYSSNAVGETVQRYFTVSSYDLTKCTFSNNCTSWWTVPGSWVRGDIFADVEYTVSGYKAYGRTGMNPKEYTASLLRDGVSAKKLGDSMYRYIRGSQQRYSFSSRNYYVPGEFYRLSEATVTGIGQTVRIISCAPDVLTDIYNYEAEGIDVATIVADENALALQDKIAMEYAGMPAFSMCSDKTMIHAGDGQSVLVTVRGYIQQFYGAVPTFSIDGAAAPETMELGTASLLIPASALSVGDHTITATMPTATVDGWTGAPTVSNSIIVSVIADGDSLEIEYAILTDPDSINVDNLRMAFGTDIILFGDTLLEFGPWGSVQPTPGPGEYVWQRYRIGDGDWTVVRLTGDKGTDGAPAIDFSISCSPATYSMSSRAVTSKAQTITLVCDRQNTDGAITWGIDNGLQIADGVVVIPAGFASISFAVTCSVEGVGTKTLQVMGVANGAPSPMFLGKLEAGQSALTTTPDGPLMVGDYYLTADNIPKRFSASGWVDAQATDPNSYAMMMDSASAILADGSDVPASSAALYGWFKNLTAISAFFKFLTTGNVTVGDNGSPFKFRAHTFDENGALLAEPIFDIVYGTQTIFKVCPTNGNVFIGEPNTAATAPVSGFMYNANTKQIVSPNEKIVIGQDGRLVCDGFEGTNVEISGTLQAASGLFKGVIDSDSFSTLPASGGTVLTVAMAVGAEAQLRTLRAAVNGVLADSVMYKCEISIAETVKYVIFNQIASVSTMSATFYSATNQQVGKISVFYNAWGPRYDSTWAASSYEMLITYGEGDVFKFKNLPNSASGLETGQVYNDGGMLKIKM